MPIFRPPQVFGQKLFNIQKSHCFTKIFHCFIYYDVTAGRQMSQLTQILDPALICGYTRSVKISGRSDKYLLRKKGGSQRPPTPGDVQNTPLLVGLNA